MKIIDASYDPNQQFVDYMTFQQQNMYGNFAQLSNQFVSLFFMKVKYESIPDKYGLYECAYC